MARIDGDFEKAGEASVDLAELMLVLSSAATAGIRDRHDAMACFLSASEGWRDAKGALKGTFAGLAERAGLTGEKE
ncbi:hypothetical protein [Sphingomonas jaspsi]|uniref:hypothetical protein n=1 Tax=Sphingomonas jaspsi TaxID=392409 RepID=UPI00146FAA6D|nr:hypothetical protein [Sphingomonas jaspsi]